MFDFTFPKYGLGRYDVENAQKKIDKQKDFQKNSIFVTSNGTCKSLLDVSTSANISERYYAQLVNKVNTLQQAMTNLNLMPVFLTITLDGWLHDFYNGDYSRYDDDLLSKLPENDKYGYLATKAFNHQTFDVHDLYMVLRWQWDRFCSTRTFRKMRKETKIGYLFAVEPHLSGVPHAHVLLYVPHSYLYPLQAEFEKIFNAKRNTTQDDERLTPEQIFNGETNGFQWTLTNPVGYVLKYVTKSFMDIKNQTQIDELQAWYIKHRIVRFTTSHTLIPQWVYNKVYPLENDWLYLSDLNLNAMCTWSAEDDYFIFEDENSGKTLQYEKGLYQYFQNGSLVHEFGEFKEKENIKSSRVDYKPMLRSNREINYNYKKSPLNFGDWELLSYYNALDINVCGRTHYILIQNECIKRDLVNGAIQSLNECRAFTDGIDELGEYLDNKKMFSEFEAHHDGVEF
ncbi:hypothetical protein SUSP_001043 [Sulfurospirillum sp. 'SP']|nr:hypothetical protein [Sulfurospirillum sp. 'SP']WNY98625.1 hypothetical protein SUSP_001043 [Sulfurospirillum sp. 'SP']